MSHARLSLYIVSHARICTIRYICVRYNFEADIYRHDVAIIVIMIQFDVAAERARIAEMFVLKWKLSVDILAQ